ncbi:ParA family protein [Haladaptatus sp. CMAA 1911]|uniref:ParA family protein n=1 Tax=unclassified Haladaptatus TaxID=2622732 RepID=UPI0037542C19
MTLRVAVSQQKGGVGKTVTTKNLAAALADRGHRVLVLDADPQGGTTLKLGLRDRYRQSDAPALFDVLADLGDLTLDDLDQLVVSNWDIDSAAHEGPEGFDLIPAHIRNFRLEKHLHSQTRGIEALRMALDRYEHDYDFVLIDSPPNLGPLADGALIATENVLFPANPNIIARDSLEILFDEIDTLEDRFTDGDSKKYSIRTLGAVLNEVPAQGSVVTETRDWFYQTFGEDFVFEIPDRSAIEHAIENHSTVFSYNPELGDYPWDRKKIDELRNAYHRIAEHLEEYQ